MTSLLCLLMLLAIICDAEYTGTLLDKTFHGDTRNVQSFKTSSWKHMTVANLTTNLTESRWDDSVDHLLWGRLVFRDDLCMVYDRASECHATQHNHTLRTSLQDLAKMGKRRCMLGLTAPSNYTTELDLQHCLTQANVTSSCGTALQHCMQLSSQLNDTGISRELMAYDNTNDIGLVDSILRPVAGAMVAIPIPAFLTTLMCFEFVPGMTGAIESAVMTGALVTSLLGAISLGVWETLRRIPHFQHRLHPTLQMSSNTSSILR
ncbi:g609 [Coccomyxa elongata]